MTFPESSKTKDGLVLGTPEYNHLELNFSKKRYTYLLNDYPDFFKDKDILDIGCGWGGGTKYVAELGANHIIGVDLNTHAIELANKEYKRDNIDYIVGDITNGLSINPVDIIIAVEIVEHVTDIELNALLKEAHNLLKEDGYLYITTPERRLPKTDYPRGSHWTEYDYEELINIVTPFGFQMIWSKRPWDVNDTGMCFIFKKV